MSLADLLLGGRWGGIRELCLHFVKIPGVFKSSRERLSHYTDWFLSPLINTRFSAVLLCCLFFGSSDLPIFSAELTFGRSNLLLGTSRATFYFLSFGAQMQRRYRKEILLGIYPKEETGPGRPSPRRELNIQMVNSSQPSKHCRTRGGYTLPRVGIRPHPTGLCKPGKGRDTNECHQSKKKKKLMG